jgi:hypothetical protein
MKSLIEEQTGINEQGWKFHPVCFFTNEQCGIFCLLREKIASRVKRKSEKSKQACSSIRDFRVRRSRSLY